jgi:hypothetical protein
MATKIISLGCFLVLTTWAVSQEFFYKTYGGNGYDAGMDVIQLESDSSYVIVGSSSSSGQSPNQVLLMQVDKLGNFMNAHFFGGERSDIGVKVMHKENEGYWIAGYSNSFSNNANFDFYLIKLNENFEFQWQQTYGTNNWEHLWDAVLLPDNGVLLVGEVEGEGHAGKDAFVVRTDQNGDAVWQQTYAGTDDDIAHACTLFDQNSVLIAGKWGQTNSNAWMTRLDFDGNIIWSRIDYLTAQGIGEVHGIVRTDNHIYIHGHFTPSPFLENNYRPFRIMCQPDGTTFIPHFENSVLESTVGLCAVETNNVIGMVETKNPSFVFNNGPRAFLFGYNINLDYVGYNHTVYGSKVHLKSIIKAIDSPGYFTIVGSTSDPGIEIGGSSVVLIKLNNQVSSLETVTNSSILALDSFEEIGFSFYPNPSNDVVNIQLPDELQASNFVVYDAVGQKVMSGIYQSELDFSSLSSGQYQLVLETNQGLKALRFQKN